VSPRGNWDILQKQDSGLLEGRCPAGSPVDFKLATRNLQLET
jgi:hypothetical protein